MKLNLNKFLYDPSNSSKTQKQIFKEEALHILKLSGPVFLANLCQFGMGIVDNIFLGHLGDTEMAAAALGNTWVWGTSFLSLGLVYGMDTLVSQAYGAGNYKLVGILLQNSLVIMCFSSIPVAILWWFAEYFMILFNQSPELAALCGYYCRLMLPGLLPMAFYAALQRYLNNQGIVWPALIVGSFSFLLNILLNWVLIFKSGFGFSGAPVATAISRSSLPLLLWAYVWKQGLHKKTWHGWSKEAYSLRRIQTFLKFGIFGGLMVVLEVWGFEITNIVVGSFHSAPILAAHTIAFGCLLISWQTPMSLSVGTSTRIGNYLGEGATIQAKNAAKVAVIMTCTFMAINSTAIGLLRKVFPRIYTNVDEVIEITASILPLAAVMAAFDGGQTILGGILRGAGKPKVGTVSNFIGYYLVSIPLFFLIAFHFKMKLMGIWISLVFGLFTVCIGNLVFCVRINFEEESKKAQERSEKSTVVEFEKLIISTGDGESDNKVAEEADDGQNDDSIDYASEVQMHTLSKTNKSGDEEDTSIGIPLDE